MLSGIRYNYFSNQRQTLFSHPGPFQALTDSRRNDLLWIKICLLLIKIDLLWIKIDLLLIKIDLLLIKICLR